MLLHCSNRLIIPPLFTFAFFFSIFNTWEYPRCIVSTFRWFCCCCCCCNYCIIYWFFKNNCFIQSWKEIDPLTSSNNAKLQGNNRPCTDPHSLNSSWPSSRKSCSWTTQTAWFQAKVYRLLRKGILRLNRAGTLACTDSCRGADTYAVAVSKSGFVSFLLFAFFPSTKVYTSTFRFARPHTYVPFSFQMFTNSCFRCFFPLHNRLFFKCSEDTWIWIFSNDPKSNLCFFL